jgi:hypothetical protein
MERVKKLGDYTSTTPTNDAEDNLDFQAKIFIQEVLKLGAKNNLFDRWINSHNMNPDDLSTFIGKVADILKEKWSA